MTDVKNFFTPEIYRSYIVSSQRRATRRRDDDARTAHENTRCRAEISLSHKIVCNRCGAAARERRNPLFALITCKMGVLSLYTRHSRFRLPCSLPFLKGFIQEHANPDSTPCEWFARLSDAFARFMETELWLKVPLSF
jgi:hypothetical protein